MLVASRLKSIVALNAKAAQSTALAEECVVIAHVVVFHLEILLASGTRAGEDKRSGRHLKEDSLHSLGLKAAGSLLGP